MPAVEPPSQAEFARKVAREVAKDLVPHYARRVMLGVVVLIVAVVVFLLLR
jgi:hypothetical protein